MSRKIVTTIVVIVLLAGMGVLNYVRQMDPTQLAARGVGQGGHGHDEEAKAEDQPPPMSRSEEDYLTPMGPEGAPVKIQAVYSQVGTLQSELWPVLEKTATLYAPHVRVEFVDVNKPENRAMVNAISKDMYLGLIINGEVTKEVPISAFGMVSFAGSPAFEAWHEVELRSAIERELEKKGVQFESHLQDAQTPPPGAAPDGHQH